ncbi:MAG: ammonia-forming cytochrome c nitrite reductase subunit c552, partial [Bacteroidota bacterium]
CVHSGQMDCLHCHDAGGSFRFSGNPNNSCLPCHSSKVENPSVHTFHAADSTGSLCISCHMPSISNGGRKYTNHSMLPPMPSMTLKAGYENACNTCHTTKSAWWAENRVKYWYKTDYESSWVKKELLLKNVGLPGRNKKKTIAAFLTENPNETVYTTSLIRELDGVKDSALLRIAEESLGHSSPLVRSAAIDLLGGYPDAFRTEAFYAALSDDYRIVRISAIAALLQVPDTLLTNEQAEGRDSLISQYTAFLLARPDDWQAYKRLGDLFFQTGKYNSALKAYESAIAIDPLAIEAMISAGNAYARGGNLQMAIMMLRRAIEIGPDNESAHWNLALVYLENQQSAFAESEFRKVLDINGSSAPAAYNLAVIISDRSLQEAVSWIRKAVFYAPDEPKYIYTLAFYLNSMGKTTEASGTLRELIKSVPEYGPAYLLLGSIYEQEGMLKEARQLYMKGLTAPIPAAEKEAMSMKLQQVGS